MRRIRIRTMLSVCVLSCLMARLPAAAQTEVGEVSFANSGAAAAQETFLRGLALLHNFEYPDAAEQFRKAQTIDPDFAMAYWGEAMTYTHPVWMQQDLAGGARRAGPARRHSRGAGGEGEDRARARLPAHRGSALRQRHQGRARLPVLRRDGRAPSALSGRRRRHRLLRSVASRHGARRARLRDLHAVGGAARGGLPHPSASPGSAALPDPFLRRSDPRTARRAGGAALRRAWRRTPATRCI